MTITKSRAAYDEEFFETFFSEGRLGLYKIDVTIWIYFLVYIAIIIWEAATHRPIEVFQLVLVIAGMIILAGMLFLGRNKYDFSGLFGKNIRIWLLPVINLIVFFVSGYLSFQRGGDLEYISHTFEVAMWENLTFGLLGANIVAFILGFFIKKKKIRYILYFIIVIVTSAGFGIAHIIVQQGNWNNIGILFGAGIIFIGTAFLGVPSLGVTAHVFNNLVLGG